MSRPDPQTALRALAQEFVDYHTGEGLRRRTGSTTGCSNCGCVGHYPTCHVFRFQELLAAEWEIDADDEVIYRILVTRWMVTNEYMAEFHSADGLVGGAAPFAATPVGALAELCSTLIKIAEDDATERARALPVPPSSVSQEPPP